MKKRGKILAVILVVILSLGTIVGLAACGGMKTQVGVFLYKYDDAYIQTVRTALEKEFKGKDVNLKFYNGQGEQATQSTQIDTALATTDVFIVNVVDNQSDAGKQIAKKISDAGKKAIFFNREIVDEAINVNDSFSYVGTDPNKPGYMIGEMIADMIPDKATFDKFDRNKDGFLNYVMLRAEKGNPEADGRTKYSVDEANRLLKAKLGLDYNPLKIVGEEQVCDWDTAKADLAMTNLIQSDKNNIDLVIANNDGMAFGAVQALVKNGFNTPNVDQNDHNKYIPVFGVDALPQAIEYIKTNQMTGTVKQDGEAMAKAITTIAMNIIEGKDLLAGSEYKFDEGSRKLRIPYTKITANDVKK